MTSYRIYTEDKNSSAVVKMIGEHGFHAATVYMTEGLWNGKTEPSIVIEIIEDGKDKEIRELAQAIKVFNHQEAVLVTRSSVDVDMIL